MQLSFWFLILLSDFEVSSSLDIGVFWFRLLYCFCEFVFFYCDVGGKIYIWHYCIVLFHFFSILLEVCCSWDLYVSIFWICCYFCWFWFVCYNHCGWFHWSYCVLWFIFFWCAVGSNIFLWLVMLYLLLMFLLLLFFGENFSCVTSSSIISGKV